MGEREVGFGEALSARLRRRWFLYLAASVFYCLDIYLTLLVLKSGAIGESNPVNRNILTVSGAGGWVAFRVAMLLSTTVALLVTFTLATITLSGVNRQNEIDRIEEVVLGAVMLFYAIVIVHNLVSIMTPAMPVPQLT